MPFVSVRITRDGVTSEQKAQAPQAQAILVVDRVDEKLLGERTGRLVGFEREQRAGSPQGIRHPYRPSRGALAEIPPG